MSGLLGVDSSMTETFARWANSMMGGDADIRRKIPRVLSFSSGNHQCIGQPLARLEARVAFEEWFARVSSFERKGQPELAKQMAVKGFTKLPVAFERRAAKVVTAPEDSVVRQTATAEKLAGMSDQQLGLHKRQIMTVKVAGLWNVSSTVKLFALTHPTGVCSRALRQEAIS
jgi:hypothetical protein